MKQIAGAINQFNQEDIATIEKDGKYTLDINGQPCEIELSDIEILTEDIPGWVVANLDNLTVALDVSLTKELKEEGISRELINRIQNYRKDLKFEVTDSIKITLQRNPEIDEAINNNISYICSETLADSLEFVDEIDNDGLFVTELVDKIESRLIITKSV